MEGIPNAQRQGKLLTLEQLAEMTSQQQKSDGGEIKTTDLTSREEYDPRRRPDLSAKVDSLVQFKPAQDTREDRVSGAPSNVPSSNLKVVTPADVAPPPEPEETHYLEKKWVNDLDMALERDKAQMWENVISPMYDKMQEAELYGEEDELALPEGLEADDLISDKNKDDEEGDLIMDMNSHTVENVGDFDFDEAKTNEPVAPVASDITAEAENSSPVEEENSSEEPVEECSTPNKEEESAPVTAAIVHETPAVEEIEKPAAIEVPTSIDTSALTDKVDVHSMDLNQMFPDLNDETDDESNGTVELTEEDEKEALKSIQMLIRKEAKPVANTVDLASYKISSKATSASKVLTSISNKPMMTANWVLPNAGRPFTMSALQGSDIEKLDPSAETGLNEIMRNKELYSVFYNYIIDANKPESFEAWAKTIPFADVPNLYFGAYRSSFSHSANLLPYQCNHCKNSFMEKHSIESMVKFENDEAKAEIKAMLAKDPTTASMNITSKLFPVSDEIAISFKTPSLYNIVFETASLPEKFRATYQNLVYYINCIEDIFYIDHTNKSLIKVEAKIEPTDVIKTISNRYKAYAAILQKLTPDQFSYIPVCLKEIDPDRSKLMSFQIPETVCPKCGKKIEATPIDAVSLLFTRLRLQTILVI